MSKSIKRKFVIVGDDDDDNDENNDNLSSVVQDKDKEEQKVEEEKVEEEKVEEQKVDHGENIKPDHELPDKIDMVIDSLPNKSKLEITQVQDEKSSSYSPQLMLKNMLALYYQTTPYYKTPHLNSEIEVKFGNKGKGTKPLTRIDFDNVIQKLKSSGFQCQDEAGTYYLRIYNEFLDRKTGKFRTSAIRTEITNFNAIQEFCRVNDIKKLLHSDGFRKSILFVNKSALDLNRSGHESKSTILKDVQFPDFNFSVSYRRELEIPETDRRVQSMIHDWHKTKKSFRFLNRVTFYHPDYPIKADISIVKNSGMDETGKLKTFYTMAESGIFANQETYDMELEIDNKRIGPTTPFHTPELIEDALRKTIKFVLAGLQHTNYPISISEQKDVQRSYMRLIHGDGGKDKWVTPDDFIGPQSFTLEMKNIVPVDENNNVPNIRQQYVVTEKADGERCMLYVSDKGKLYLLNTSMHVIFTGAQTRESNWFNTLLDGEWIRHDKEGNFINLFAAFDIYILDKQDVRTRPFLSLPSEDKEKEKDKEKKEEPRYSLLRTVVSNLKPISIVNNEISPIAITHKLFEYKKSIFDACHVIQKKIDSGLFSYHTDGLIFTPALFGVGADAPGKAGPLFKRTWDHSFKWKPGEMNTIDFLVTTQKTPAGEDIVTPIFEDGLNNLQVTQFNQFKTLVLHVGFDERKHGYLNPCQDVIENRLPPSPTYSEDTYRNSYKMQRFYPTDPSDVNAGLCKIMLHKDGNGVLQMKTQNDEVFHDMTIVEFGYNLTRDKGWRWIPLRVRYDKTSQLKQSWLYDKTSRLKPNYGNDYNVADSNWRSIHNPITVDMITTGQGIPDSIQDDNIYYNRQVETTNTQALRDFHNFVKMKLITGVSQRGDTLIDMACGKAGDLPKWIAARLSFVFGVDVHKDNLENRLNGACARYLNARKENKQMPSALFVHGDCRHNIRSGLAMLSDKAVQICKAVFGEGPRDARLGEGVLLQYGKGGAGFHVTSCQFAIHYFMENKTVCQNFMRNLAECTALNGYFIGTCYDGQMVFNRLKTKSLGESMEIKKDGVKVWEIVKEYDQLVFEDDISSLGYRINVYQESINKLIPEFLVNFNYLTRVMENYGFRLITPEEARDMGMPDGTGLFEDLFVSLKDEIKKNPSKKYGNANNMTEYEKRISFLNRYFVFKKIRMVNSEKVVLDEDDVRDIVTELEPSNDTGTFLLRRKKTKKLHRSLRIEPDQ